MKRRELRKSIRVATFVALAAFVIGAPAGAVDINPVGSFTIVSGYLSEPGPDEITCAVSSSSADVVQCSADDGVDSVTCFAVGNAAFVAALAGVNDNTLLGFAVENSTSECVAVGVTNSNLN